MSRRGLELQEVEANRSDPEDRDYDDRPIHTSPRKRKSTHPSGGGRAKRKRRKYDLDDQEDEIIGSSEEDLSFSGDSEPNSDTIERTASGRPRRAANKPTTTFKESSDEEEDEIESDTSIKSPQIKRPPPTVESSPEPPRLSLIVKLQAFLDPEDKMPKTQRRSLRRRTASKSIEPTRTLGTRRSSRHSETGDLYELTNSGRHAQTVRKSATPEPVSARSARAARKMLPQGSAIIEASQEDSQEQGIEQEPTIQMEENEEANVAEGSDEEVGDLVLTQQSAPLDDNGQTVAESVQSEAQGDRDEDEDDEQPLRGSRRARRGTKQEPPRRPTRSTRKGKKSGDEDGSDFEPAEEEEEDGDVNMSESESPRKDVQLSEASSAGRRSARLAGTQRSRAGGTRGGSEEGSDDIDQDELAEEAADLQPRSRKRRRQQILYDEPPKRRQRGEKPDYRIYKPETLLPSDDEPPQPTMPRGRKSAGPLRSLLPTMGPFGGAGGPGSIFAGPEAAGAVGGADSDSSDDESALKSMSRANVGGAVGMTPTSAVPQNAFPQALNADPKQAPSGGGPANFGKMKEKTALADTDPLGIDQNVRFDGVGGLDNHINQLKEMVSLPLLYPEAYQQFKITPPRGVLFHGPPGTGKTLLARALAASVSKEGRKVTFYMRKGADALSKWVGEAERQLRLLFEEARKNQPSIIFFDEIDGLAPVRSSKQEQIHASIVATLLALMDGMDGRGQVIVIGATNRPDSVDPALRRPGRFDREFFFPLPNLAGRRAIIDIHTKGWAPPLEPKFKDQLANLTKGYGGADLRALCTEAALNAVQGTYPQIYRSDKKLRIDPTKIKIQPKDFMISIDKMIPSSERSGSSRAGPIENEVEPLLRKALEDVSTVLDDILPTRPKRTALEEAEYDDRDDVHGFDREILRQKFDRSRVYRPRLLIQGHRGMGQQYLGSAILHKYERLHVQSFDLPTLYSDATRTPEAAVVQLFNEVRRHKPSVIYLPNVNLWYETVGRSVTKLFAGLLRSLPPNDPVLVLGIMEMESEADKPDDSMFRELFGFSGKNQYNLEKPSEGQRREFFYKITTMINTSPDSLPEAGERRKRQLPELEAAPAPAQITGPSKADLKAQKKQDMQTLNMLKISIQPIMDHIKNKYKKFRHPAIDESRIAYLCDEQDPTMVSTDLPEGVRQLQEQQRPFELREDAKGVQGLYEIATRKFYYNIEITTIERRLSNGYYKRYKDFLADIKRLAKDAKTSGDDEKLLKANELLANVQVDLDLLANSNPGLVQSCEQVYAREKERERSEKERQRQDQNVPDLANAPPKITEMATQTTGPITLGEAVPGRPPVPFQTPQRPGSGHGPMTNGDSGSPSHRRNSTSELDDDTQMENSQDRRSSYADTQPHSQYNTQPGTQQQRSQKSAMTPLAHNSQPGDYHNSASTTTTSDKKTSDKTGTQSSNGIQGEATSPDLTGLRHFSGQSALPDTQEMGHSSSQSQPTAAGGDSSQRGPMPPPPPRGLSNLLNATEPPDPSATSSRRNPSMIIEEGSLAHLLNELTRRSSGCSVEQLEQIHAVLMDAIWRTRGQWNRQSVVKEVKDAFNGVITDIETVQGIFPNTQSSSGGSGSGRTDDVEDAYH